MSHDRSEKVNDNARLKIFNARNCYVRDTARRLGLHYRTVSCHLQTLAGLKKVRSLNKCPSAWLSLHEVRRR
ncbi:hypothetical protein WN51_00395 [Melipona quadrifasciata]|uniref:Uncharacterized protein n=1 Tax=Melipona quadrifasciata TaxID=166423 RepID=A0A0N0BGG9_9HYME|nr:hypothetical protein WN51_00395 [Melipona quadrifasciata]